MDRLNYELGVLARAVAHKNLSGASGHVGLSQPQLSRIVKRIEEAFSIVLLDRSARRNAAWTPQAHRLAEIYGKKMRALDRELEAFAHEAQTKQVMVGTLEGLIPVALPFVHRLLEAAGVRLVEIDVFDLDRLEALFTQGELDLVFTSRSPGRKKFGYVRDLGFQSLDPQSSNPHFQVMSTFEHGSRRDHGRPGEKILVSNSLAIRKEWFGRFGGVGTLPSPPRRQRSSKADTEPVLMIGADTLSPTVWKVLSEAPGI